MIKKIKPKIFKKIIIIDVWKYSNSNNLPEDILFELFSILGSKTKISSENWKKIFKSSLNTLIISMINKTLGTDLEKISTEKSNEEIMKNLENLPKTIIFFDNLERVGKGSWDILKAIQKLSILNNFIFILPMNKKRMIDPFQNNEIKFDEHTIEKYLTLPFFSFKQNYLGILKDLNFNDNISKMLNNFLETPNKNSEVLTARQAKKEIENSEMHSLFNEKGKYSLLRSFLKIWPANIKSIIYLYKDIEIFIKTFKEIKKNLEIIELKILEIKRMVETYDTDEYHYIEYDHNNDIFINNMIKNIHEYFKYILKDWKKDYQKIIKVIESIKEKINFQIEKNINNMQKEDLLINNHLKDLINIKNIIKDNYKKIIDKNSFLSNSNENIEILEIINKLFDNEICKNIQWIQNNKLKIIEEILEIKIEFISNGELERF